MWRTLPDDRGQAFSLEGIVAATVVLLALLYALQSVLLTPITVGSVDESTQSRIRAEANDILRVTADQPTEDLDYFVRYWSPVNRTFAGAVSPELGYGMAGPPGHFGAMLEASFAQQGRNYNVIVHYRTKDDPTTDATVRMVYQGKPSDSAVVATRTVTLFDDMRLTGPARTTAEIGGMDTNATDNDDSYFYAPDAYPDAVVYNVLEVRIVVW